MQIVHEITESSSASGKLFNAAHVFSSLNRKMLAPVDSQGNAQAFALNVKVYSESANTATFESASNSYVTKQAIKSWFRVWKKKFTDDGVSMKDLGPYGRVFKPRLESSETLLGSGKEAGRGEWNYSDMITTPAASSVGNFGLETEDVVDQYTLHLIGTSAGNDGSDETRTFTNVGMINSWLGSRRQPIGADGTSSVPEDLVFDQDNPLLLARGGALTSETLLDEVRDLQKDEPPYDEQDFDSLYVQGKATSNANLMAECDIVAPCGLVKVTTTAACTMIFTLVGIGDM